MTVYDNMAFGLKLRKVPKDQIDKMVKEAAKILDLEKLLDRKPKALSGGQRQRVAMGLSLIHISLEDKKRYRFVKNCDTGSSVAVLSGAVKSKECLGF